jgi:hypothetical protein
MPQEAPRGSRVIALLVLNLDARWGLVVKATPRPLYPCERAPVPIVNEAGWAPGPVWTDMENRKSLAPTGVRTRTVQPVASRYTGPQANKRNAVEFVSQLHKFFYFAVPNKDSLDYGLQKKCHFYAKYVSFNFESHLPRGPIFDVEMKVSSLDGL